MSISERALSTVLGPDALGDTFGDVHDGPVDQLQADVEELLRLGMQVGWLSDELTWNAWRERIGQVRCGLLEDLGRLQHSDDTDGSVVSIGAAPPLEEVAESPYRPRCCQSTKSGAAACGHLVSRRCLRVG